MFAAAYSTMRGFNIHLSKSPVCRAANKGTKQLVLDTRPTDAMVGGSGAAGPTPDLQRRVSPSHIFSC